MEVRVPGAPTPDPNKPYPRPAVPRGWKMNDILPYYSPAMTGGGVSDNFFKDMMAEMQGMGGMPGAAPQVENGGGGEGKQKKPKKKVIRA
jgi:signal recognition particle subunit SRP19